MPPPPARSKAARNPFVVFGSAVFSLLLLAAVIAGGGLYVGGQRYSAKGPLSEDKTVLVPRGSGTSDIADTLEREGVIDSPLLFGVAVRLLSKADQLKAGEYFFKAGIPMDGVVDILVEGKGIQHSITFPEGLTSQMIIDRLRENDVLTGDITTVPAEGTLLPDTYRFERGTTREQLVARMQASQKKLLDEVWKRRSTDIPLKSPQELVTLASIVEKETGKSDERPRVASVFLNRLIKRMKLQSDPTIIYGIVGGKGKLDRPINKNDITQATQYNTYVIPGLPPGPIANPGRASLEATANPSRTQDLFFVADGTGGHAFAATLEDHNRNVERWRELERQTQDAAAPAVPGDATSTEPVDPAAAPADPQPTPTPTPAVVPAPAKAGKKQPFVDPVADTPKDPLKKKDFNLNAPQKIPKTP